ncbi:hypothetical protein EV421DRAFT_2039051 [Armillaria borealis]|uniref:Uncharacterized protein n=1 Tax=Armillaria borealis TaxID=47425 RepID=A0AA39MJE8_9AGAR|nr:hypothetical protein EV421DRAFT_2039051 [Armillaria borealis]
MSTSDVAMLSVFPKNIFDASNPTACLAFSIPRTANRRLVCGPVGNTVAFLNSTPPTSIRIVPPAVSTSQTKPTDDSRGY